MFTNEHECEVWRYEKLYGAKNLYKCKKCDIIVFIENGELLISGWNHNPKISYCSEFI